MTEQFSNNGNSTLNGAITAVATTLVVLSASTFPTKGTFRLAIESELLICTSVSGTTFTVTRGADGSTAAADVTGTRVNQIASKQALANHITDLIDYIVCYDGQPVGAYWEAGIPARGYNQLCLTLPLSV